MAQIRFFDSAGQRQTLGLGKEPVLIGRHQACQIIFTDDLVSREHTRIEMEKEGRYVVRDLGSRNKTYVNGQVAGESLLQAGDFIRIGEHVLEYVEEAAGPRHLALDFLTPDREDPPGSEWIKVKSPLTVPLSYMERLARLTDGVGLTARPEDIADATLARLILAVQGERGFVAMRGARKRDIHVVTHRGLSPAPTGARMPVSQTFVHNAILQQVSGRYPAEARQINPDAGYAATGLVAPLMYNGAALGLVYVDRPASKKPFSRADLHYLTVAGAYLGGCMAQVMAWLARNAPRQEHAWLSTLRRLQSAMTGPAPCGELLEVASSCLPGQGRCGDFCDYHELGEHRAAVVVVDGGGQGVAGLVQAEAVRSGIETALKAGEEATDLARIMTTLNRTLAGRRARQRVPCTVVLLDLASAQIRYLNAGGMPPLLLTGPGRLVTLDQPALLLGVDEEYPYETTTVDAPPQFRLVLHTDGLVDAGNAAEVGFGEQRLHEALLDPEAFLPAEPLLHRLSDALNEHLAGNALMDDALICVLSKD